LSRACVLLITTPSPVVTLATARHARQLQPDLHIVARAEANELLEELHELGVYEVVLPQMEAGLEVTRQALLHLQMPEQQIERFADEVRHEFYGPLRVDAGGGSSLG
jgi:CPA2 family monovalent cation:H+ antiporter-2